MTLLRQLQHILHIVQTGRLVFQPQRGTHCAFGKGHTAAGFVGDFDALAFGGEQNGVIAHNVARTNSFKADFCAGTFAGKTFAAVNSAFFQVATQCIGNHFAHAQRRA